MQKIYNMNMTQFDLETRTLRFSKDVRDFLRMLSQTNENRIYGNQLLRSSSSIGANYIEANDALGKKDFYLRIKTSRKEAKETSYWLNLIECNEASDTEDKRLLLIDESNQLVRILSKIAQSANEK